jgi:ABC-type polysaccharide/polyol phosphate transport system ATPase subunit
MPVIELDHVTKEYRLSPSKSLKATVSDGIDRLLGRATTSAAPFKALDDVSFCVEPGEVVGIIGRNGAGKSTLLKILAHVTQPTRGKATIRGSVAPLIEVGAGFVADLTGRENVYVNGAILGLSRSEISRKMDEIVAFAELEQFIDTPLKRYSSGMAVRLGFAVATSVDADVLIIDEVLAVGDLDFQRKCFDRMEDIIKRKNKTLLIVGHNVRQLERISTRMILLDKGSVVVDDLPARVCNLYLERTSRTSDERAITENRSLQPLNDTGEIEVTSVEVFPDGAAAPADDVVLHKPMSVRVHFTAHRRISFPEVIIGFHTNDFVYVGSASSAVLREREQALEGPQVLECTLPDMVLRPGVYYVRLVFSDQFHRLIWYGESLRKFRVVADEGIDSAKLPERGLVDLPIDWTFRPPG